MQGAARHRDFQATTEFRLGSNDLNKDQLRYACRDVLHLHILRDKLDAILERENRRHLAQLCFDFLPHRVALDLAGWYDDIFAHSQSG